MYIHCRVLILFIAVSEPFAVATLRMLALGHTRPSTRCKSLSYIYSEMMHQLPPHVRLCPVVPWATPNTQKSNISIKNCSRACCSSYCIAAHRSLITRARSVLRFSSAACWTASIGGGGGMGCPSAVCVAFLRAYGQQCARNQPALRQRRTCRDL